MKRQQNQAKKLQDKQDNRSKKICQMEKFIQVLNALLHMKKLKNTYKISKESKANANNQVPQFFFKVSVYQCLYRRSVGLFNRNRFSTISDDVFKLILSFDGNFYICKICGKKLNKNNIPRQAVWNMLEVCELSKRFRNIRYIERVLTIRRLLFKKRLTSCGKVSLLNWMMHYVIYLCM